MSDPTNKRYKATSFGPVRALVLRIRDFLLFTRHFYFSKILKMDLAETCRFSLRANFDRTNPRGVHIGHETYVAFGVVVFTHDMCREFHADTFIGERCFIGANAIIMPGVRIGNQCIIGSGSVVTTDIPDNSIAAGNPARIIKSNIKTRKFGKIVSDNSN